MQFSPTVENELCGILSKEETIEMTCSLFPNDYRMLSQYLITACLFQTSCFFSPCPLALPFLLVTTNILLGSKADTLGSIFDVCCQLQHQLKIHWPKSLWGALNKYKFLDLLQAKWVWTDLGTQTTTCYMMNKIIDQFPTMLPFKYPSTFPFRCKPTQSL